MHVEFVYKDNNHEHNISDHGVGSEECLYPSGMIVKQGDIAGIVDSIRELHAHPLSTEDCRKRAETYFDKDKCFEEYIRLYESLI